MVSTNWIFFQLQKGFSHLCFPNIHSYTLQHFTQYKNLPNVLSQSGKLHLSLIGFKLFFCDKTQPSPHKNALLTIINGKVIGARAKATNLWNLLKKNIIFSYFFTSKFSYSYIDFECQRLFSFFYKKGFMKVCIIRTLMYSLNIAYK